MSKTFRDRAGSRQRYSVSEEFRCRHCRQFVGSIASGGRHRNHCPFCLYSRHVDGNTPGDRASLCGASMAPIAVFRRPKGEVVVVHRCHGCGFERHNRVAADDDVEVINLLPVVAPRLKTRRDDNREWEETA